MTTTRYIATDEQTTAIYGIGDSPEAAIEDAREQAGEQNADAPHEYVVYPASEALSRKIERDGGGPDICWTVMGRETAVLDSEVTALLYSPTLPAHWIAERGGMLWLIPAAPVGDPTAVWDRAEPYRGSQHGLRRAEPQAQLIALYQTA